MNIIYKEIPVLAGGDLLRPKYALYCRVSTREQNLDNQKLILEQFANNCGWDYELFQEQESTRKTRPVKYALLQRLRRKEFKGVVVVKLDRWARSTIELINEVTELYERGVIFISIKENLDFSTSTGRLQFGIMSAFAQFESDLIRERTLDGLARARNEGKKLGRPRKKPPSP